MANTRQTQLAKVQRNNNYDFIIIGGGATGLGTALDASLRGYKVLLLEKADFGKGTSSKSTKLVHGGVRYLAQGNIKLVMQALKERGRLLANAPTCTNTQKFVIPTYSIWAQCYYFIGLKVYDLLSGKLSLGATKWLAKAKVLEQMPSLSSNKLFAGIEYTDGAFDDTRLLMLLYQHAQKNGSEILNYCSVNDLLLNDDGIVNGVVAKDSITNTEFKAFAKVVINATGVFADAIMKMANSKHSSTIQPSQGIHLVIHRKFFQGSTALMIPKTADGRVLFAVPWQQVVLVGTTDTPVPNIEAEPVALDNEIDFVIQHFNQVCSTTISRTDVDSVYVGLRPLLQQKNAASTSVLSRDHAIIIDENKLLTITGGKWTTYRKMAADAVSNAVFLAGLPKQPCTTSNYILSTHPKFVSSASLDELSQEQVAYFVHYEMAQTVEDILARRTRILFRNVRLAEALAPSVATWLMDLFNETAAWREQQLQSFYSVSKKYKI